MNGFLHCLASRPLRTCNSIQRQTHSSKIHSDASDVTGFCHLLFLLPGYLRPYEKRFHTHAFANPIPHYNVFFPPDFYTAWRVIRRTLPTLPQDPSVAATWAKLLGHGALDARAEPGPAAEVLALLWEAAKVRAFSSSCFGVYMLFDPLDLFVALCDLGNYYERAGVGAGDLVWEAARAREFLFCEILSFCSFEVLFISLLRSWELSDWGSERGVGGWVLGSAVRGCEGLRVSPWFPLRRAVFFETFPAPCELATREGRNSKCRHCKGSGGFIYGSAKC